jgi:hypothetical protein
VPRLAAQRCPLTLVHRKNDLRRILTTAEATPSKHPGLFHWTMVALMTHVLTEIETSFQLTRYGLCSSMTIRSKPAFAQQTLENAQVRLYRVYAP